MRNINLTAFYEKINFIAGNKIEIIIAYEYIHTNKKLKVHFLLSNTLAESQFGNRFDIIVENA